MRNMSKHDLHHTEPYARLKPSSQKTSKKSQKRYLNQVNATQLGSSVDSLPVYIEILSKTCQ